MFIVNVFENNIAIYIHKNILVLILYNLRTYSHNQAMKSVILTFFFTIMDTWCKMKSISIRMHPKE